MPTHAVSRTNAALVATARTCPLRARGAIRDAKADAQRRAHGVPSALNRRPPPRLRHMLA